MEFKKLNFQPLHDGVQAKVFFDNGYGASIVKHSMSYGGNSGLYELAVLVGDEDYWDLTYETEVTDDVLGHLDESEIEDILIKIKRL